MENTKSTNLTDIDNRQEDNKMADTMTEYEQLVYSSAHFAAYAAKTMCEYVLAEEEKELANRSKTDESAWKPTESEVAECMAYIQEKPATDEQIQINASFLLGFNAGMDAEEIFGRYIKDNNLK